MRVQKAVGSSLGATADGRGVGLRLMVFDATCSGRLLGLSAAWRAGSGLYRGLGRLDACLAARSWPQALAWLAEGGAGAPLAEVQFWGHGKWGRVLLAGEALGCDALAPRHPWSPLLREIRDRMVRPQGLWWFRTCETFGAQAGRTFAREWAEYFGCRAAGHTHVIGFYQSGLHSLRPGEQPTWPAGEGLCEGTPDVPIRAHASGPRRPNTITCLQGRIPQGW